MVGPEKKILAVVWALKDIKGCVEARFVQMEECNRGKVEFGQLSS
jgi:hypothetical protein